MAKGGKVADLFAALGIEPDKKSFDRARDELGRFVKQADSKLARVGKGLGKGFLGLGKAFGKAGLGVAGKAVKGAAIGGFAALTFGAKQAISDAIEFDSALTDLGISSAGAMGRFEDVRNRILDVSKATGVSKEQILGGARAFVALTGDGKAASESMLTFARVSKATGADMEDIAGSAAALVQQLRIAPGDMERAFSILVRGGKQGAIELKDMAQFMAGVSAQFKQFAGSEGTKGLATISSAFQIAAQNFGGDAAQTATGLERLMESFAQPRTVKALKSLADIDVFTVDANGEKRLRSFTDLIEEISESPLATDPEKLAKAFESAPGKAALRALIENRVEWGRNYQATLQARDIGEDYATKQKSASAQLVKLWNDVKIAVAGAFTPERVAAFVEVVKAAAEAGKGVVGFLGDVAGFLGFMETKSEQFQRRQDVKALTEDKSLSDEQLAGLARYSENAASALKVRQGRARRASEMQQHAASLAETKGAFRFDQPTRPDEYGQNVETNITVNVPAGSDAKAIGGAVRDAWEDFWHGKLRHVSGAGGSY